MFKWSVLNTIFRKHTRKTSKDTLIENCFFNFSVKMNAGSGVDRLLSMKWRKWNTRLANGTKNVSFVAHATIQLAQNPSSPKNMTFIVPSAMKTSLPPSVSNVTRYVPNSNISKFWREIQLDLFLNFIWMSTECRWRCKF